MRTEPLEQLLDALKTANRIGVLVFDTRAEQSASAFRKSPRFMLRRTNGDEASVFATAQSLQAGGCDLILAWGMADALGEHYPAGALIVPTRVIDTAADESFETVATTTRRTDRVVLLSTHDLQDLSVKRRLAMRYQAAAADADSATVARFSTWNGLRFAVVCSIADTAMEVWAERRPSRVHSAIKRWLPERWRPWFVSPSNIRRRWREQNRARRQLTEAAQSLANHA